METPDVWKAHVEWIRSLSDFLGCPLRLVEGSELVEADSASGTCQGVIGPPHPGITFELLVKLLTSRKDDGGVEVWALTFLFVDKQRVAPQGQCCLALEWRDGQWHRRAWESDDTGEWADLKTLA